MKTLIGIAGFFLLNLAIQVAVSFIAGMWYGVYAIIDSYPILEPAEISNRAYEFLTTWSMALLIVSHLLTLGVVWFYAKKSKKSFGEYTGLNRSIRLPAVVFYSLLLGVSCCIWGTFVINMLPLPQDLLESYGDAYAQLTAGPLIIELIATILVAPIVEEILFRGLVFERMKQILPLFIANILQALLFGCLHGNVLWTVYAAVFGCILGFVRITTNNLRPPILVHIAFNGTSQLLSLWLVDRELSRFAFYGIFLLSAVLLLLSVLGIHRQRDFYLGEPDEQNIDSTH